MRSPHPEWPLDSGALALKAVIEGEREYWIEGRRYVLRPGRYLLCPGEARPRSGRTSAAISMMPVWFSPSTARGAGAEGDEAQLEGRARGPEFGESLLPRSPGLDRAVGKLWTFARSIECGRALSGRMMEFETHVLRVLATAAGSARRGRRQLDRLSSVRTATRQEIVRRLSLAEDRLRGEFRQPLSLGDLARTSAMSPYHFLRRFSEYYGATPHRFVTRLRLARARALLERGDRSVKQVAHECGYRSVPSFVHLCVREWGMTPAEAANRARHARMAKPPPSLVESSSRKGDPRR